MGEDKKLNLIVQATWEGQAAQAAQADIGKLAQVAKEAGQAGAQMGTAVQGGLDTVAQGSAQTAVRMAALEAKARETAAELRKLAQDVVAGNKSFEEAEAEYAAAEKALEEYRQELGLVDQETKKTSQSVEQGKQSTNQAQMAWLELSAKINIAQQAFQAVAAVARRAYDAIKEGARLEAVTNTFGSLSESIGETADSLQDKLRTAVRDTVSDMALMEGSNRFIAMGLASTGEEAAELSTIASQLGLAFRGDAVAGMEEFALLLANQSIPRLDTFGISAGRVRARIEELVETVPGMTRETAFMQATMEQARLTMGKIGDQTQGTAGDVARLESAVSNLSGSFKAEFAQASAPVVGALADIAQGFVDVKRAADDAKGSVELFIDTTGEVKTLNDYRVALLGVQEAIEKVGPIGSPLSPLATVDTRESLLLLLADYGRAAATTEELNIRMEQMGAVISDTGVSVDGMGISWIELDKAMARLNEQERLAQIDTQMGRIDEKLMGYQYSARAATEATGDLTEETEELKKETFFSAEALDLKARAARRAAEATRVAAEADRDAALATREQLELLREEEERLAAATGDYFTTAVNAGNDALVSWNRTVTTTGGLTSDQADTLEELTSAYERTQGNIRSLQSGVDGLGLSEEDLNKKLEEQYGRLDLITQAMTPLQGITTEVTGVTEGWKYNQEAINDELYKAADAAGASAEELALLGLATGQLSEAQAIAALKSAALQTKIEELGTAIAKGMDPTEALNRLDAFQQNLEARDFTVALGIEVEEGADTKARDKVSDVIAKGIPESDRKVDMVVSTEEAELSVAGFVEDVLQPTVDDLYEVLLQAETEGATTSVNALKDLIDEIKDKTVTITTVYRNEYTGGSGRNQGSDGASQPYATGGIVRGGIPGVDSVPARLMPGEVVIPNYATNSLAEAMAFVSRFVPGGIDAGAQMPGATQGQGGGDIIHIHTQDRSDEAVRNIQRYQRQKELARGFT